MGLISDRFAETIAAMREADRKTDALIQEHLAAVRVLLQELQVDADDVTVNNNLTTGPLTVTIY